MDDDKETRLRDQFAMAAMQALIDKEGIFSSYIHSCQEDTPYVDQVTARLERLTIVAYRVADMMRKTRMAAFK
jgi:hypothetical protein